jgi:hypothetical protein
LHCSWQYPAQGALAAEMKERKQRCRSNARVTVRFFEPRSSSNARGMTEDAKKKKKKKKKKNHRYSLDSAHSMAEIFAE